MAYPFHDLPTFVEFKQKLHDDYQVDYIDEGCKVQEDGANIPHSVWFFRREVDGETRTYGLGAQLCGGDIDIAVITPNRFDWAQRKRWSIHHE